MKLNQQLVNRFHAQQFEIVDMLDEFLLWCQQTTPEVRQQLKTYFEPVRGHFFRQNLLFAFLCIFGVQVFLHYVLHQPWNVIVFGLNFVFTLTCVCCVRWVKNVWVRRRFMVMIKEVIQVAMPASNYVFMVQDRRIRRVSRWFVPVRQFNSKIPGKEGHIVIVLSPTEPKLMFVRDNA